MILQTPHLARLALVGLIAQTTLGHLPAAAQGAPATPRPGIRESLTPDPGVAASRAPAATPAPPVPAPPMGAPAAAAAPNAAAAPPPRPPASPPVPGAPCLIAEFRTIALGTHNPTERERLIRQWLHRNIPGCSVEKLVTMGSNRASWLGTADSPEVMGMIDTAIEAKSSGDPAVLKQLYDPQPRSFPPSTETLRTEPPNPILAPSGAAGMLPPIGMVNLVRDSGASEGGRGAGRGESGAADFNDAQRKAIRDYFAQSQEMGDCPPGLIARAGRCLSQNPDKPWKLGEPLPRQAVTRDLPNVLVERLGGLPAEGYRMVRSETDVLMLDRNDRVVGAVVDYGQPDARPRPAPRPTTQPGTNATPR